MKSLEQHQHHGSFQFEARRIGKDTTLARIVRLVEEAQGARHRYNGWRISLPVICAGGYRYSDSHFIIRYFAGPPPSLTYAFLKFIAVLVIACHAPWAATPTAIMVGTGKGAEYGFLYERRSSGKALQNRYSFTG
jgi:cation transport ATPase